MSFLPVPRGNIRVFISCVSTIVERYHRSYGEECLQRHRPATLQEVTRPSLIPSSRITIGSVHIRAARVTMCLLGSLFPAGPPCLPFQNGWTQIAGWSHSITKCFCAVSVGMAARAPDLEAYYIHPQLAGSQIHMLGGSQRRPVCGLACGRGASRSCRRSGLVRQEMAIDEYLKYIRAEALAYERRFSTRSGGEGLASTRTLVAGRVPASSSSFLIRLCRGTSGGRVFVFIRGKPTSRHPDRL
jgi:hypothetical protein